MVKRTSVLVLASVIQMSCGSNNATSTHGEKHNIANNVADKKESLNDAIIGSWKIEAVDNQKIVTERILQFREDGLMETPEGVTKYKVVDNSTIESEIGGKKAFISDMEIEGDILTMTVEGKKILAKKNATEIPNATAEPSNRKIEYLYQNNGGFTVYFSDGTYARRAGEYTDNDIKTAFKNIDISGKWAFRNDGVIEDNETLISFKTDDGTIDYGWVISNTKSGN